ncbi:MAG: hypothetical protein M1361_01425 [Patescibacteria group bacterium]|nr:hypothetical protein [Patescibacteria group bacterium]MCL5224260.1 hypothetical protein [Patescibacteria group bacterium]
MYNILPLGYVLPFPVVLMTSSSDPDGGWDDGTASEQGNNGEDTGDYQSAGYGADYPREDGSL